MDRFSELQLKFDENAYVEAQLVELEKGKNENLDYSIYDNPEYDWYQMREIRKGLQSAVDVFLYAKKKYNFLLMREFRRGLEVGMDLSPYYESGFSTPVLRQIRKGKEQGIDLISYAIEGYDSEQLEQIAQSILEEVDLKEYVNVNISGSQMEQLRLGLKQKIDISLYSNLSYNWMQMQEIRLGLEKKVDINWYNNILFSWRQMREIRKGLLANIPVERYAKFVLSYTDMRKKREWMEQEGTDLLDPSQLLQQDVECKMEGASIRISEDEMHAYINIKRPEGNKRCKQKDIVKYLNANKIKLGILEDKIIELLKKEIYDEEIEIASGKEKEDGKDGEYHFLIDTEVNHAPKLLEDGSVDYQNIDLFVQVKEGDVIATYEPATAGIYGFKVTGEMSIPKRGKDLPKLHGKGIQVLDEGEKFVALQAGRLERSDYYINIVSGYIHSGDLTAVDGNINFGGDVQIHGDVTDNVCIQSGKNIEIYGNVGAAKIIAEGDVLIKGGINANGEGEIIAGGSISGKYFEQVSLKAKKDIRSNYILNSMIYTEGSVIVSGSKGAIIGGKTEAIRGVDSFSVGNASEVETRIEIGQNDVYVEAIQNFNAEIKMRQEKVDEIENKVKLFASEHTKEELKTIPVFIKMLQWIALRHEELNTAIKSKEVYIKKNQLLENSIQVLVKGTLHPSVIIQINYKKTKISDTYTNVAVKLFEGKVKIYGHEKQ